MNNNNYIMKLLVTTTIIALIFMILSSCLVWEINMLNKELEIVQNELVITQEKYQVEITKKTELIASFDSITAELEEANATIDSLKSDEYEFVYMGNFKITYYCDERYSHICGGNGITASGKPTEVGVTAAADWSVLPKGSTIYIEGIGFREVQDVGGGVNGSHVDILVKSHSEALSIGTSSEGVWLLAKKNS